LLKSWSFELSPRLRKVAEAIPDGVTVADIGTGHGLLPAYLIMSGKCPSVVATERTEGPYNATREFLEVLGLAGKVDLRMGDGLEPLAPGESDVAVIAGMGGRMIADILSRGQEVARAMKCLILQPSIQGEVLRIRLCPSYRILAEEVVEERGRFYEIIVVAYGGFTPVNNEALYEIGPVLYSERHPMLTRWIHHKMQGYRRILARLDRQSSERAKERRRELTMRLNRLHALLVSISQTEEAK